MRWKRLLVLLAAAAAMAFSAVDVPSPQGRWQGAIDLPGQKLDVLVRISAGEGGVWSGGIDIPAQGARNLPLGGFDVARGSVRFSITGIPGDPTFRGTLAADGATLAGEFTQGGQTFQFRLARAADTAVSSAKVLDGFDAFDSFVDGALKTWNVPGLAVAIIKDGEVVLAKGYGLRDVKRNLPVTPDTLFAIGSATKAFTVMSLGVLVDDGKLDWDTPVHAYLPAFALQDQCASAGMTPRDLVTHRSGLPRHDLVWYNATLTRAELFERAWRKEARPFMGDALAFRILDRLAPLLGDAEARERVLDGDLDYVRTFGIDRWIGGVHLQGHQVPWRWDDARETLVRS